jgi:hypothetical protein
VRETLEIFYEEDKREGNQVFCDLSFDVVTLGNILVKRFFGGRVFDEKRYFVFNNLNEVNLALFQSDIET